MRVKPTQWSSFRLADSNFFTRNMVRKFHALLLLLLILMRIVFNFEVKTSGFVQFRLEQKTEIGKCADLYRLMVLLLLACMFMYSSASVLCLRASNVNSRCSFPLASKLNTMNALGNKSTIFAIIEKTLNYIPERIMFDYCHMHSNQQRALVRRKNKTLSSKYDASDRICLIHLQFDRFSSS